MAKMYQFPKEKTGKGSTETTKEKSPLPNNSWNHPEIEKLRKLQNDHEVELNKLHLNDQQKGRWYFVMKELLPDSFCCKILDIKEASLSLYLRPSPSESLARIGNKIAELEKKYPQTTIVVPLTTEQLGLPQEIQGNLFAISPDKKGTPQLLTVGPALAKGDEKASLRDEAVYLLLLSQALPGVLLHTWNGEKAHSFIGHELKSLSSSSQGLDWRNLFSAQITKGTLTEEEAKEAFAVVEPWLDRRKKIQVLTDPYLSKAEHQDLSSWVNQVAHQLAQKEYEENEQYIALAPLKVLRKEEGEQVSSFSRPRLFVVANHPTTERSRVGIIGNPGPFSSFLMEKLRGCHLSFAEPSLAEAYRNQRFPHLTRELEEILSSEYPHVQKIVELPRDFLSVPLISSLNMEELLAIRARKFLAEGDLNTAYLIPVQLKAPEKEPILIELLCIASLEEADVVFDIRPNLTEEEYHDLKKLLDQQDALQSLDLTPDTNVH